MIEYIKYKEKKYPVRISTYAMKMFQKETEKSIDDLMDINDIALYEPLLYYSMIAGAKAEGVELDIPKEDIEWVLDECFVEFIRLIPKFFPENVVGGGQAEVFPKNRKK
jgi:hypothetical protein